MDLDYQIDPKIEEELSKNPYKIITDWAEEQLKLTGRKVFQFLALQPISIVAPDIPSKEVNIRTNFHVLLIAPPSSGKTTSINMFRRVTYNPIMFQDISGPKLIEELNAKEDVSLLCGDTHTIFNDMELIKILEGVLEEKTVQRFNMRRDRDIQTNAIFLGACLPQSLRKNIKFGLIQRMVPVVFFHTPEERAIMGKWMTRDMFNSEVQTSFLDIKYYYKKIQEIQKSHDEKFAKIDGYHVSDKIKDELYNLWKKCFEMPFPEDTYFNRELQSPYRYLCCSAILNIFNREIVKSNNQRLIVPNNHDLEIAKQLFIMELRYKWHIMYLDNMALHGSGKDILRMYEKIKDDSNIDYSIKQIHKLYVENAIDKGKKGVVGG